MMQLYYSPTSPFVRKVSLFAIEKGLQDQITHIPTNAWDAEGQHTQQNPLGQVPTLITPTGTALYDSTVICEYLDSLHANPILIPPNGESRWQALRLQALADGLAEAGVITVLETRRRPQTYRWQDWIEFQQKTILRGLDSLEKQAQLLNNSINVGTLAVAAAIGYLEFRAVITDWHTRCPALQTWYNNFSQRASMQATLPKDPPTV